MKRITEPERKLPVVGDYDVIVCGGGPAGVAAAISSARAGAKTGLVELHGCLGGIWTAGLMPWIIDHANKEGLMVEFKDELLDLGVAEIPERSASFACDVEVLKWYLEKKCVAAGVDIMLHYRVASALVDESRRLTHVVTESKSGREALGARCFVDATGDGDLSALAGCEFDFANPESGLTQPMSMIGLLTGLELEKIKPFVIGYGHNPKVRLLETMREGGVEPSYSAPSIFHLTGDLFVMMANHQYKVFGIDARDLATATIEGREEVNNIVNALRRLGGVWKDMRLAATSEQIGVREGRRIKGKYQLTIDDLIAGARFDDEACVCTFCLDVHATDPDQTKGFDSCCKQKIRPYGIPLRALMSKDLENLFMAGRCVSGDFLAHSSYRVTGNAVPMGEAVGKAAAETSNCARLSN